MKFKPEPGASEREYRYQLKKAMLLTGIIMLAGAVVCVMEVYALLALQFCDGEDLMSLYWATWTMLQMGSEIAILGIVLALYHHLTSIEHP
jgi:hypothetical protein